jgi:hypothetical protein
LVAPVRDERELALSAGVSLAELLMQIVYGLLRKVIRAGKPT